MIEQEKGIPDFDSNGNLPYKCWNVSLKEIKESLVDNFPDSTTRKQISMLFKILKRINSQC